MTEKNIYNYRTFELIIFPKLQHNFDLLTSLVEDFTYRYNSNRQFMEKVFTSKTLNRILGITMPKIIKLGYIPEKYISDIQVLFQIAYWDYDSLSNAQVNQWGSMSYKTDQHQTHYNSHCYTGNESAVNQETY